MKKLMSDKTATSIKTFLQGAGALATAISGICLGMLAIMRVFYPDPKPETTQTQTTGVTELK